MAGTNKAVFLDRDGVLNRALVRNGKPYAPRLLSEFEILPDVPAACEMLVDCGYTLFVVTNQPDIGNGLVAPEVVEAMHGLLLEKLPIRRIYMCPHRQNEGCACRKPKPGMLLEAQREFSITMEKSYMIGDRYGDVEAGIAAGCEPLFIDQNYIETPNFTGTLRVQNLLEASMHIVSRQKQ